MFAQTYLHATVLSSHTQHCESLPKLQILLCPKPVQTADSSQGSQMHLLYSFISALNGLFLKSRERKQKVTYTKCFGNEEIIYFAEAQV